MNLKPEPCRTVAFMRKRKWGSIVALENILACIPQGKVFSPAELVPHLLKAGHSISLKTLPSLLEELAPALVRIGTDRNPHYYWEAKPAQVEDVPHPAPEPWPTQPAQLDRIEAMLKALCANLGLEV